MSTNSQTKRGCDVVKMTTSAPSRHPKEGSRDWDKATYEAFDYNYGKIDWSKKRTVEDPNAPVCAICNGESPKGTCAGCH